MLSTLPPRVIGSGPDIVADAQRHAGSSEMERFAIANILIGKSRTLWRGTDEEILQALGYRDANEFWETALSEPVEVDRFAHMLAVHQIDPSERPDAAGGCERRSKIQQRIDDALQLARRADEPFFIGSSGMLRPREAVLWLLSTRRRRDVVPPGLRRYLEPSSESEGVKLDRTLKLPPPKARRAPPPVQRPPGIVASISQCVCSLPAKQTEAAFRSEASKQFQFTDKEWRAGFARVPSEHKRRRGQKLT